MSQPQALELPPDIKNQLIQLSQKTGRSIDELTPEYWEIYAWADQIDQGQFKSATPQMLNQLRHSMAIGKMWKDTIYKWPEEELTFVYLGHGGLRVAKASKRLMSDMFMIVPDKQNKPMIRRLQARGERSEVFRELMTLGRYHANLTKHPQGTDYRIEDNTVINLLAQINMPIDEFNKILGIAVIKVKDTPQYLSKKQGKYTDSTDWRCIFGTFGGDPRTGDRKDGKTQYGVINIIDETCDKEIRKDAASGRDIYPGISAWVAPEHLIYTPDSFCAFYGTLDLDTATKKPVMNCYMIRPIGAKLVTPKIDDDELEEYA